MCLAHGSHELTNGLPVSERHDGGQGPNLRRVYASIHIVWAIPSSKFGLVTTVGTVVSPGGVGSGIAGTTEGERRTPRKDGKSKEINCGYDGYGEGDVTNPELLCEFYFGIGVDGDEVQGFSAPGCE